MADIGNRTVKGKIKVKDEEFSFKVTTRMYPSIEKSVKRQYNEPVEGPEGSGKKIYQKAVIELAIPRTLDIFLFDSAAKKYFNPKRDHLADKGKTIETTIDSMIKQKRGIVEPGEKKGIDLREMAKGDPTSQLQNVGGMAGKVATEYDRIDNPDKYLTTEIKQWIENYSRPLPKLEMEKNEGVGQFEEREKKELEDHVYHEQADKELYQLIFASFNDMFQEYEIASIEPSNYLDIAKVARREKGQSRSAFMD